MKRIWKKTLKVTPAVTLNDSWSLYARSVVAWDNVMVHALYSVVSVHVVLSFDSLLHVVHFCVSECCVFRMSQLCF